MTTMLRIATIALFALVLLGAWKSGVGAYSLWSVVAEARDEARGEAVEVFLDGVSALRLRPDGTADTVDLGTIRDGVIFAFDASCGICNQNMGNWIELVGQGTGAPDHPAGRVHAIGIMPAAEAWAYWTRLHDRVAVFVTDTATIVERLRIPGPPATLIVRDGIIRHRYTGFLDTHAKAAIAAAIAGD
jgi:hypothetical protein